MKRKAYPITFAAVIILVFFSASLAGAAMVTYNVTFNAFGFTAYQGSPVPTDPVNGSFRITFDPSLVYHDSPLPYLNINIPLDSAPGFNFDFFTDPSLTIGGLDLGVDTFSWGTNDFFLTIRALTIQPTFFSLAYGRAGIIDSFNTYTGSVTASLVPIPSAVLLLGTGLSCLAYYRRRKLTIKN